jgi:hypothetical protein
MWNSYRLGVSWLALRRIDLRRFRDCDRSGVGESKRLIQPIFETVGNLLVSEEP